MTTMLRFLTSSILLFVLTQSAAAQMISPDIDRPDEPFCYFSKPTDVIGVMDGRQATLVSPEGFFYTGWGELMFFTGNPPVAIDQRVKTLMHGDLPVVQYTFDRDGVRYEVRAFAATLDGDPGSPLVNFIRVTVANPGSAKRAAWWSAGVRYEGESNTTWGVADNRFGRPASAKILGQFEQAGTSFSRDWVYAFDADMVLRDSAVVYRFPSTPPPDRMMTLKTGYNEKQDSSPSKLYVSPTTPVGIVQYRLLLAPGESRTLDFIMPYEPMRRDHPQFSRLRTARFDDYLPRTVEFWEDIFSRGIDIQVPEEKVVNTFKASLVYDLIARNKEDGWFIQKVNDFQYHAFWLRDASCIVRMYDLSGYHDIARQCLAFFSRWQQPDGNFVSQGGQYDGWGETLWAYGEHFRLTGDREFAASVYPSVVRAVEWLKKARSDDPYHIIPVTTPGDNEDISGHITGHNFIALGGLKNAIALAVGLNKVDDEKAFEREYNDFHGAFLSRLKAAASRNDGAIAPGLDTIGGQDWGNLQSIYPEEILPPHDPLVTATLNRAISKYREGLMTYGDGSFLHHYVTLFNTETEIIRGDQERALNEFYSVLLHTSATHAGFEFAIRPWGTRDFMMNLSPHGWFAAEFRVLLRNMLVREEGSSLHLFSVISPEWVKPGRTISVKRAPTDFGVVNVEMTFNDSGAVVRLDAQFSRPPDSLVLHLPWFATPISATAEGSRLPVRNGEIVVPLNAKVIQLRWREEQSVGLSYDSAVQEYKKEYGERYKKFLESGE